MMKNIIPFPDTSPTHEQAAIWLAKQDRGKLSSSEQEAFEDWLAIADNKAAYHEISTFWNELDVLQLAQEHYAEATPEASHRSNSLSNSNSLPKPKKRPTTYWWTAVASVIAGLVFLLTLQSPPLPLDISITATDPDPATHLATTIGEIVEHTLSDQSRVILNTDTQLDVHYSSSHRHIYMRKGEAQFNVTKDASRPFIVYAGNGQVQAIGTLFSVRVQDQQVAVSVNEGVVKVTTMDAKNSQGTAQSSVQNSLTLTARGIANYADSIQAVTYVKQSDIERSSAWTDRKWIFEGERLAEVINEINRYTQNTLIITDDATQNLRIGGYFNLGEVDTFLNTLEANFNIGVKRTPAGQILLSIKKPSNPAKKL